MREADRSAFAEALTAVYALYRVELSPMVMGIWWGALKAYDLAAVRDALGRHAMNPDAGQFCPKPADVVRMIEGSTVDSALAAWAKVVRAIRIVGAWQSVVFDDPLIHAVVDDMGGWPQLCRVTDEELPFRGKEFEARYRGLRGRSIVPEYRARLVGISESENARQGFPIEAPITVGDPERAAQVMAKGRESLAPARKASDFLESTKALQVRK